MPVSKRVVRAPALDVQGPPGKTAEEVLLKVNSLQYARGTLTFFFSGGDCISYFVCLFWEGRWFTPLSSAPGRVQRGSYCGWAWVRLSLVLVSFPCQACFFFFLFSPF